MTTDRMIESYAGEWEMDRAKRMLAEIDAHLAPRENETDAEFTVRHDAFLKHQASAPDAPGKPKTAQPADDLYSESAREKLLAAIRAGTASAPTVAQADGDDGPVSMADPALYSADARATLLENARAAATRASTLNTPRG